MAEYIERETFLKDIEERHCSPCKEAGEYHNGFMCAGCWVGDLRSEVIGAPTADVAPVVHGQRIEREEKPIFPHELVGPTEAVADYLLDSGVTAQEWISVKDRLPKNDEIVIICTDKNFIYAGELIGDTWFLDNDSWTATVTHWMPLPQPPKGE